MEKNVIHKIGRRKTSVARIYLKKGKGNILINGKATFLLLHISLKSTNHLMFVALIIHLICQSMFMGVA